MSSIIDVTVSAVIVVAAAGVAAMVVSPNKAEPPLPQPKPAQVEEMKDVPAQSPISSDEFRIKKIEQKLSVQGQKIDELDEKLNLLLSNPPPSETDNGRREPRRQD